MIDPHYCLNCASTGRSDDGCGGWHYCPCLYGKELREMHKQRDAVIEGFELAGFELTDDAADRIARACRLDEYTIRELVRRAIESELQTYAKQIASKMVEALNPNKNEQP